MDWYQNAQNLIDMRSFGNLWYWIVVVIAWASASYWVLGVPWGVASRAHRSIDEAHQTEFEALAWIHVKRIVSVKAPMGLFMVGLAFCVLSGLFILGWFYRVELAQALFLLLFPLGMVAVLSIYFAHEIVSEELEGEALYRKMFILRITIQGMGILAIFLTSLWAAIREMALYAPL